MSKQNVQNRVLLNVQWLCVVTHATNWRYVWKKKTGRRREAGGTVCLRLNVSRVLPSHIISSCTDDFGYRTRVIWEHSLFGSLWLLRAALRDQWRNNEEIEDTTTMLSWWHIWFVDWMSLGVFCHTVLRRARDILVVVHLWSVTHSSILHLMSHTRDSGHASTSWYHKGWSPFTNKDQRGAEIQASTKGRRSDWDDGKAQGSANTEGVAMQRKDSRKGKRHREWLRNRRVWKISWKHTRDFGNCTASSTIGKGA